MRIMFLTYAISDNEDVGEVRVVWETVKALALKDHCLRLYVVTNYCNIKSKIPKNVKVYQMPFGCPTVNFTLSLMLKTFLFSLPLIFLKRIQIIHLISTNAPCPYTLFKIRPFVMSADKPWEYDNPKFGKDLSYDRRKKKEEKEATGVIENKNFVIRIWDRFSFLFFSILKLNDSLSKRVDLYVCRSRFLLEELKKSKYPSKLFYIPHGVDVNFFYPKDIQKNKDVITFLFVGRISKRKGVEVLIKTFNKLSKKYKKTKLILVGRGALSTISYLKSISGENIEFGGCVSVQQMNDCYNKSDIFILPSLGEPCSLTTLEAMAAGKPVISTRGGVDDFFIENEMGFWVEPGDEGHLYGAMEKFILDSKMIDFMGEKTREHVVNNFTWDVVAKRLIEAYESLIINKKM